MCVWVSVVAMCIMACGDVAEEQVEPAKVETATGWEVQVKGVTVELTSKATPDTRHVLALDNGFVPELVADGAVDLDFDGTNDFYCKGTNDAGDTKPFYFLYLPAEDHFEPMRPLTAIPNPVFDAEKKCITSEWMDKNARQNSDVYVWEGGVPVLQSRAQVATTGADSGAVVLLKTVNGELTVVE